MCGDSVISADLFLHVLSAFDSAFGKDLIIFGNIKENVDIDGFKFKLAVGVFCLKLFFWLDKGKFSSLSLFNFVNIPTKLINLST